MAGSATNLTGMLTGMANSMGQAGNSIGRGLFNPLLEMQGEERARTAKESERLAEQKRKSDILASVADPMKKYQLAVDQGDAPAARKFAEQITNAGVAGASEQVMQMGLQANKGVEAVALKGAMKGVSDIDQALAGELDPKLRKVLTERRETLTAHPDVAKAMQAQKAAQLDFEAKEQSLANARLSAENHKRTATSLGKSEAKAKQSEAGTVGGHSSLSMDADEVKQLLVNKSAPYLKAFHAQRRIGLADQELHRVNLAREQKNIPLTEEQHAAYGVKSTYENYLNQHNGESPTAALSSLNTESNMIKRHLLTNPAPVNVASAEYKDYAEGLLDSTEWIGLAPPEEDTVLLALALANSTDHTQFVDTMENGQLTEQGRMELRSFLASKNVQLGTEEVQDVSQQQETLAAKKARRDALMKKP